MTEPTDSTDAPVRPADPLVETQALTKRYPNGTLAVDELDLTVHPGEVYGFLGPNGAGKTTTLRMLLGLIRPTGGTATVLGHAPGRPSGLAGVGALVEAPAFYPYLSGRRNLQVLGRYAGVGPGRADAVLDEVGLAGRGGDKVGGYSLGMKQRLGVATALLKRPALLILDEPTNGLDPQGMADMRTFIRSLGRGDRTVLLSSHLLGEVEQICDRVGVIRTGRLIAEGTIAELRGAAQLLVRAEPADEAGRIAAEAVGEDGVRTGDDGALRLSGDVEPAALNERLVTAGVAVSELRPTERSLEETFLELTGDGDRSAGLRGGGEQPS